MKTLPGPTDQRKHRNSRLDEAIESGGSPQAASAAEHAKYATMDGKKNNMIVGMYGLRA
jgi:hypothetical protein